MRARRVEMDLSLLFRLLLLGGGLVVIVLAGIGIMNLLAILLRD